MSAEFPFSLPNLSAYRGLCADRSRIAARRLGDHADQRLGDIGLQTLGVALVDPDHVGDQPASQKARIALRPYRSNTRATTAFRCSSSASARQRRVGSFVAAARWNGRLSSLLNLRKVRLALAFASVGRDKGAAP